MNTISWATPTTPLPMEINPRVVFERMFGRAGTAEQRLARMQRGPQHPRFDRGRCQRAAARTSARAIAPGSSEYLENVREIERRIQRTEAQNSDRA